MIPLHHFRRQKIESDKYKKISNDWNNDPFLISQMLHIGETGKCFYISARSSTNGPRIRKHNSCPSDGAPNIEILV